MEEEPVTTAEAAEAADVDIPAEEETLSEAEERLVQEQEADPAVAPQNIHVPTCNLDARIPIAPQVLDADTPQISVGAADDGVEIVNLEDSEQTPVAPEPPRITPTDKRPRRRKMPAHRKKKGRLIIRLRETSSTETAEAAEDEGRPTQTADNFASQPVHRA
jgi:hypothetical protein